MRTPPQDDNPDSIEKQGRYLSIGAWAVALALAALAVYLAWQHYGPSRMDTTAAGDRSPASYLFDRPSGLTGGAVARPELLAALPTPGIPEAAAEISRRPELRTIIPTRPRQDVITYTVDKGDSVFEIADHFNLTPESVLWANYSVLNDNPDLISLGMELRIPPTDGVLYEWQPQDSLTDVAGRFKAAPQDILHWPGNDLDLIDPRIAAGTLLMVPGGQREFRQWLIPTIPRGAAGVASSVYGGGACTGSYEGAYGTGTFVWPAGNHILSGNDFWPGHLAIDIAAGDGAPIYAADSGVIVFAGWANGGYGNTVVIDHGNGYQTLYAHMSSVTAHCGQSASQGAAIGIAGSTGNSTGTHLHFEVRYQGGFISPWFVLPPP